MKRIIRIIVFLNFYYMNAIEKRGQQKHGIYIKKNSHRTRDIIKKGAQRFKSRTVPFIPSTF